MSYSDNIAQTSIKRYKCSLRYQTINFLEKCKAVEKVAEQKAQEALTHLSFSSTRWPVSADNPANEIYLHPKRREVLSYMIEDLSFQIVELQNKVALLEKQLEQ